MSYRFSVNGLEVMCDTADELNAIANGGRRLKNMEPTIGSEIASEQRRGKSRKASRSAKGYWAKVKNYSELHGVSNKAARAAVSAGKE